MKNLDSSQSRPGGQRRRPVTLAVGALVLIALVVAACGQAAPTDISPTLPPAAAPTTVPPTQPPAAAPTPEPTVSLPTTTPPVATPPVGGGTPTAMVGEAEVELEDFQFVPKVVTVRVGTTVKFSNKDKVGHTVTSDTGLFDSGTLAKGEEFFFTFTAVGEYPYYCAPHGGPGGVGMSGLIIVVP